MEGGQPTAYICQAGTCSNGFTNAVGAGRRADPAAAAARAQQQVRQRYREVA